MAPHEIALRKYHGDDVTDDELRQAAQLFNKNYGIWGSLAESKIGSFAKAGRRVRMSVDRLRTQCLPDSSRNTLVVVQVDGIFAGYVFASRWVFEGRIMCWITQLCVSSDFRRLGLATRNEEDRGFGLLTSHPAAVLAALRAFGRGPEEIDHSMACEHGRAIMQSCPVKYVRDAKVRGSIFEEFPEDGIVSCADTGFFVDHNEPLQALENVKERGIVWPYGNLLEGHEFLIIVKSKAGGGHDKQFSSDF